MEPIIDSRLLDRFWSKVIKTENCWYWTGKITNGYGYFRPDWHGMVGAHRWLYSQSHQIPPGTELDHLCNNPSCVRPDHLEPVTHQENMVRGVARGGARGHVKEYCVRGHPMSTNRNRHGNCRACDTERARLYRWLNR